MTEYGIFNGDSADWTAPESVEAGFYSEAEAAAAIADRYTADDELTVHVIEEPEEHTCETCGGTTDEPCVTCPNCELGDD